MVNLVPWEQEDTRRQTVTVKALLSAAFSVVHCKCLPPPIAPSCPEFGDGLG